MSSPVKWEGARAGWRGSARRRQGAPPAAPEAPARSRRDLLLFITRLRPAAPVNTSLRRVIHRRLTAGAAARAARLGGPAGVGSRGGASGACPSGGACRGGASGRGPRTEGASSRPTPPAYYPLGSPGKGTSPSATTPLPLHLGVSLSPTLSHLGSPWGSPGQGDRSLHSHLARGAVRADLPSRLGWSGPAPPCQAHPVSCSVKRDALSLHLCEAHTGGGLARCWHLGAARHGAAVVSTGWHPAKS